MPFNKFPAIKLPASGACQVGFSAIRAQLLKTIREQSVKTVVIECYHGVFIEDLFQWLRSDFADAEIIEATKALKPEREIRELTFPSVTDDRIFGFITTLQLDDLFDSKKVLKLKKDLANNDQLTIVIGIGAALLVDNPDLIVYADMARWEIQLRMRKNEIANIGISNRQDPFETKYKRGYFLDWRLCDQLKKNLMPKCHYILDTCDMSTPKMISRSMFEIAIERAVNQPFSLVPFFDPGTWGGQWMKEKFNLDPNAPNMAWGFNCVPEENSILFEFDGIKFEMPAINLVFFKPKELLGKKVQQLFGDEFPIRYDFLDTIGGGNLSLQVHPSTEYIWEAFGMTYTQDESYYILDATENATVYLGLKEDVDEAGMIPALLRAQESGEQFDADNYTQKWPAKKHDHFLIPAGTVHCSGEGCMILEISATPYIFTFKLWDWGRLGLDGQPRPINIEHGAHVIQWARQTRWTKENLINNTEVVATGEDWREEHTGLHQLQFIETRRYFHLGKVKHVTGDSVNVLMVVEGEQAVIECPDSLFKPFIVNFAEAFIIPANVKEYTVTPYGQSEGKEIITIKAFVRT